MLRDCLLKSIIALVSLLVSSMLITGCRGLGASPPPQTNPAPNAPQVVSFTSSAQTIAPNSPVTLSWVTANATSVMIDNGVGKQPPTASFTLPSLAATTTFHLTAQGANGTSATASTTVTVSAALPTVSLKASPTTIRSGQALTLSWTTTNATNITFTPTVPEVEDTNPLPNGSVVTLAPPETANTVVTYTATVTGPGGSASSSVNVTVMPPAPTLTFTADSTTIAAGTSTTLRWITQNANSVTIDNNVGTFTGAAAQNGSATVSPAATTTYTATANGQDGTTVTQTVTITVNAITLTANPTSVSPGGSSTLTWSAPGAATVSIVDSAGNSVCNPCTPPAGGNVTVQPRATTTYTATATNLNNQTSTASATVTLAGLQTIKHIIFFVQENRAFDNYFSQLGTYKASDPKCPGCANDVNLDYNPNVVLTGRQGIKHSPFHERTELTHNLTPSWNESHFDIHVPSGSTSFQCTPIEQGPSNCKMDRFMLTTSSIPESNTTDPNGDRAIGFYDQSDLNYYYELASQFAVSDRWFSPLLANTIPNRLYIFSATSQGNIRPPAQNQVGQFTWPTIFDAMDNTTDPATGKPISWKYYYLDNSVFLAQWATWTRNGGADQGKVRCIDEWFNFLSQPNADQLLPDVVFIERGGSGSLSPKCSNSATGVDEHPDANIQKGASETEKIINAFLNSSVFDDSVFILTYDEGGGTYDHVPPFNEVEPDSIPPNLQSGDAKAQFNQSGFRVPAIIISPFAKPHYVSHTYRDTTSILKFIESRFNVPALTARDAAQPDMSEFFDFSVPGGPSLKPPAACGTTWTTCLPTQLTNGAADVNLETFP